MIFDAKVEVTCDACGQSIQLEPEFKYTDYSGKSGYYDTSESALQRLLELQNWILESGKQYCSAECLAGACEKA